LFHNDTRFLSQLELFVGGRQPLLLGSNTRDDNALLTIDLTNPEISFEDGGVLEQHTLHIVRTIFLWRNQAHQRLAVRNHGDFPIDLRIAVQFGSDFADLFEVRGARRKSRGIAAGSVMSFSQVVLSYEGLDGKRRCTNLTFDPPPLELLTNTAVYR